MEYDSAPVTEPIPLLYPYRASFRAMDQFIAAISSGLTDLELRQDDRNRHIIPKGFKGDLFIVGMDSTQFLRIDGRIAVGRMAGPHHRLVAYIDAVGLMEGRWKPPSATGVFTPTTIFLVFTPNPYTSDDEIEKIKKAFGSATGWGEPSDEDK